ncbi:MULTISPECIES: hypothetical protein [Clostridium]|uniref:Uncharacterized protein n=2 Tax=Clostridium TaxID=1485 RepID=D8GJK1_CLOLD|nr:MULTISPECIES: hypothetical protein [Clostridium]ADK15162.1 conserved hypothetical protein [Clostridium ljungdahlii DSM 13528]AGY74420.1 hypothetical protein CAETHG_0187 [Clostridium autoethanogenum DSM 10061]ALU34608.1 Hypothetical protein CLAU_0179 [Clostridium autoethanogenum DSM 10061]OAA88641.1 hypothetical protein WX45_02575 [Clostridium ljungdahlii DSM 13528]OVY51328.1 hypothetical protein WX72_01460 [Clostridium autoethanogenum]
MNREYCIFDEKKSCNNCGECEVCDLDSNKKCDNCGKCLEMEGYDMKAIKIDQIIDDKEEVKEYQEEDLENSTKNNNDSHSQLNDDENSQSDLKDDKINVQFIDDIDGLKEILEDREKYKDITHEDYPGLIRIKKKKETK